MSRKDEVISQFCQIARLVQNADLQGDAADCFCRDGDGHHINFQFSDKYTAFVLNAVAEKLEREGKSIDTSNTNIEKYQDFTDPVLVIVGYRFRQT